MKIFGSVYDYLSPAQHQAIQIVHPGNYIKSGQGNQAERKIFFGVPYDDFEQSQISNLKQILQQNYVDIEFDDAQYLRFIYAYRFQMDKIILGIKIHREWINNPSTFDLNPKVLQILEQGQVYISSRDRKYRPLIQINAHLIDKDEPSSFLGALSIVLIIVKQYMFYPGKIENWIIFIETNELSLFGFPFGALNKIIEVASQQFPGCLEKIFIMNPSSSLKFSWNIIEKFIDERSRKKIKFLQKSEFKELSEYFEPEQLEDQYKGTKPRPLAYWPPSKNITGELKNSKSSFQKLKRFKSNSMTLSTYQNTHNSNLLNLAFKKMKYLSHKNQTTINRIFRCTHLNQQSREKIIMQSHQQGVLQFKQDTLSNLQLSPQQENSRKKHSRIKNSPKRNSVWSMHHILMFLLFNKKIQNLNSKMNITEYTREKPTLKSASLEELYQFKDENEFIVRQKRKIEQYSPRQEPKMKDFACQVNLEEINILKVELERMKDFQKKYEQCKKVLKKVQQEYRELYNLFNIQLEDKETSISQLIQEVLVLKENNFRIDQESLLLQAENQTLRDFNKKSLNDESKSFHTFQYTSDENINPPKYELKQPEKFQPLYKFHEENNRKNLQPIRLK